MAKENILTLSKYEILATLEVEADTWASGVTPILDKCLQTGMRTALYTEISIQVSVESLDGYESLAPIAQKFALDKILQWYGADWNVSYSEESKSLHFS